MDGLNDNLEMARLRNANIESAFKKEAQRLLNFIRKRVLFKEEAEDILQDVFFQFTEAYYSIESVEKSTAWLFRVARNKITDYFRKKKPVPLGEMKSSARDEAERLNLDEIIPDLSALPDQKIINEAIWETLEEALAELPEDQREIFVLHEFEQMSFNEVAQLKGENVNTLISRKRYAILYLREKLREIYNELINEL